jgi:iron complex outermembrane receptor protein
MNDNNNLYFLYSEGFKAGGFQHDARNLKALLAFLVDSEEVDNIEVGWKGSYDRSRFAVTAFSMEKINSQANALIPVGTGFTTSVTNFGGVEVQGLEFEGTVLLGNNFMLGGNFAVYDGELGPGSVINANFDPATGQVTGVDVSGRTTGLDQTWLLFGEYDWTLGGGSSITLRADIQHRNGTPGGANRDGVLTLDGQQAAFARPEIDNVGAMVRWTSADGDTSISLWGKNLLDEYDWKNFGPAISGHFNNGGSGPGSAPRGYTGRQQVGVTASFQF